MSSNVIFKRKKKGQKEDQKGKNPACSTTTATVRFIPLHKCLFPRESSWARGKRTCIFIYFTTDHSGILIFAKNVRLPESLP